MPNVYWKKWFRSYPHLFEEIGRDPIFEHGSPEEVRVIILDLNKAMMAFPQNVLDCLRNDGHTDIPDNLDDLQYWVSQGVLVLREGKELILKEFIAAQKSATLLLWGEYTKYNINTHHRVVPVYVSVSDSEFKNSSTFKHNPEISWEIPKHTVVGFDGSCTGNGTEHASAGYAVVGGCGSLNTFVNADVVHPHLYNWRDLNRHELGLTPDPNSFCAPTNNRAEFLGGIHTLSRLLIAGQHVGREVIIVTDSMLFQKTLMIWYPVRLKKNTTHEMKNLDLVQPAYELWEKLKAVCNAEIVYEKAHTSRPPSTSHWMTQLKWEVNFLADHYATKHQQLSLAI